MEIQGFLLNRMNLHNALGYEKFYNYNTDFNIDETIGLGLSDKSFFKQAVPIIKNISKENKNFYGRFAYAHKPYSFY